MILTAFLLDTILVFLLSALLVRTVMRYGYRKQLFDQPDGERKIHQVPVPRLGGLTLYPILVLTMTISALLLIPVWQASWISPWSELHLFIGLLLSLGVLYALGVREDMHGGVRGLYKFYFYSLAALIFLVFGIRLSYMGDLFWIGSDTLPVWVWWIVNYIAFMHMLNAMNLIDGVNGLSCDISILALAVLGYLEYLERHIAFTLLAIATISFLLAFRWYNTHGASKSAQRIFMGDTGCWTIGIIMLFLIIHLNTLSPRAPHQHFSLIGFSTLIVPLMDLPRVGMYRMVRGIQPFHPDNNHIHHKLLDLGLNPLGVRSVILLFTIAMVIFTALMADHINTGFLILINAAIYLLFVDIIDLIRAYRRKHADNNHHEKTEPIDR